MQSGLPVGSISNYICESKLFLQQEYIAIKGKKHHLDLGSSSTNTCAEIPI